ncbi:unnamed protein product [Ceratitis capitata]|uniref:(Mediterranean fruit fly) hypothetical protein n=1 Tax=Ceratitis capitata TaxID=7213 RepID=W8BE62_CERCA|nr:unnamed protein product [Ceratitis capitata]
MCLYMSVPRWISLERFAGAVYDGASHLIEVSLVLFLLSCHSDKSTASSSSAPSSASSSSAAPPAIRGKSVDALTSTVSTANSTSAADAPAIISGDSTSLVLYADNIKANKLMATKISTPTMSVAVVSEQPKV